MFFFKALNRTLHRQHTQPTVIICLVHKAICRAVVSLKNNYLALTCLKYIVLLICDKCPLLRTMTRNLVRFFPNFVCNREN